jgi:Tol biopolymer transport system component
MAEVITANEAGPEPQQSGATASQERNSPQPESAFISAQELAGIEPPREAESGFIWSRRKLIASAIICGVVIVVALVVWKKQTEPGPAEAINVVRTIQLTTWSGLDIYPAISPDGNSIAYSSDHNGSFEIYVKPLTPGASEIQLTSDGGQNFQPSWAPDGKLIAYYSMNRGGICIVPASGGTVKQLTEFGSDPVWSPDGSAIAFQSHPFSDLSATAVGMMPPSTLWIVPSKGGDPAPITKVGDPPGGHGTQSWSPDGKRIIFVISDGNIAGI